MASIRRTSAVDEVFQDIQNKITSGEYPIGYILQPQKALAQEYGVGATTIREAMGKLTMLGYLSAKQGVGTTVINNSAVSQFSSLGQYVFLNSEEVPQFMEARLCLEKAAVKSAAALGTKEDFAAMDECIALQAKAVDKGDSSLFSEYDKRFHLQIMEAGRNPILVQFMTIIQSGLFNFIEEATRLEKVMSNSLIFHGKILKSLKNRNGDEAEIILLRHLWDVAQIVEAQLETGTRLESIFRRAGLK